MISKILSLLRSLGTTWAAAAFLPVPLILITNKHDNALISCLYLGLGSAYLATVIMRFGGVPESRFDWWSKTAALAIALSANVILFIGMCELVDVHSYFPLPLMAVLSATPAIGLSQWLILQVRKPFPAMVLGSVMLLAAKLTGCVVAWIVYGSDFEAKGYVAADWRTAKLMISVFWTLAVLLSFGLLFLGHWQLRPSTCLRRRHGIEKYENGDSQL